MKTVHVLNFKRALKIAFSFSIPPHDETASIHEKRADLLVVWLPSSNLTARPSHRREPAACYPVSHVKELPREQGASCCRPWKRSVKVYSRKSSGASPSADRAISPVSLA